MADTARDIVKDALRDLGVFGEGESLSDDDAARGLRAANDMLDAWAVEKLMLHAFTVVEHTLEASKASYTIGPSGADITATRPQAILGAHIRDANNIDTPIKVWAFRDYEMIVDKTVESTLPYRLAYNPDVTSGTVYLWPTPDTANTLRMDVSTLLSEFTSLDTTFTFPPGYRRCLRKNLALELAPMFGVAPSKELTKQAVESKGRLKIANIAMDARVAQIDPLLIAMAGQRWGGGYNINTDW